jgi:PAS domain S-box-containing protein
MSIVIARGIRDKQGRFLGVVTALLDIEAFAKFLSGIDVGPQGNVLVRRSDTFKLILRYPPGNGNDLNQPLPANNPIRQRIESGNQEGTPAYTASTDGVERIASFHRLDGYPFYIQVSLAESHYLSMWRMQAKIAGAVAVTLLLILIYSGFRARNNSSMRRQLRQQVDLIVQRFSDFATASSDWWFWEMDADLRFSYFSENAVLAIGRPMESMLGKSRRELAANGSADGENWAAHLDDMEHHRHFQQFEYRIQLPGGEFSWLSISGIPIFNADGRFMGYRGTGTNVSRRKLAEEASKEGQRFLQNIANYLPGVIYQYLLRPDGSSCFPFASEAIREIYRVSPEEVREDASKVFANLHPDDFDGVVASIQVSARDLTPWKYEYRVKFDDGTVHWLFGNAMPQREEGGTVLWYGFTTDITERKQKEEQLRQAELLLRSAIETIGEAFVIYDPEDRLAFCNEEYRQIYYSSASAMKLGRSFEEILRYGVDRQQYSAAIGREEEWIAERMAAHRKGNQQLIQQLEDGRWLKITERRTPSGHTVGFRVDITELYKAKQAAEAATVAKSRFLATMSHEIRTPMNGILGMAQMLLMPNLDDAERQDFARTILTSGQSLLNLLNDILDVSKVEAGKLALESKTLDPAQIMYETRKLFTEAAASKGLRIEAAWTGTVDQPGQPGQRYLGDPHRLRQMLSNLVGNAIKFTVQGQIRIEACEVERDGQHALLEFAVTDTGIGIPQEKQSLLFQPFSQTDSSTTRQYGGSGLGLSIVSSLAKMMGGDVGVESEAGQGSRFWFRIRATPMQGEESRQEQRPAIVGADDTASQSSPGTLSGRILVVDDNPTNRKVIKAMLDKPGLHCDFVEDGQQAVEAITGGMSPDLVLMDCQMPVMDGFEATQRIRRWETENTQPHLTIVALTASAFEQDRQRCIEAGMDDFLAKPIDIRKLTATLGRWLPAGHSEPAPVVPAGQAVASTQDNGLPIFDEKTLLSQLGGDRELAKAVILSATGDIPGYFDQLEQAIAAGNWTLAERQTHTMKGLLAQIGGMKLARRMKEIDDHLKGGAKIDDATVIDLRRDYQVLSVILLDWTK